VNVLHPELIANAKQILGKAWSMRLIGLSVLLMGLDQALPYFAPEQPSRAFAWLSMAVSVAAAVARLIPQAGLSLPEKTDGDKPAA
jgi:hypothetical protein